MGVKVTAFVEYHRWLCLTVQVCSEIVSELDFKVADGCPLVLIWCSGNEGYTRWIHSAHNDLTLWGSCAFIRVMLPLIPINVPWELRCIPCSKSMYPGTRPFILWTVCMPFVRVLSRAESGEGLNSYLNNDVIETLQLGFTYCSTN